MRPHRFTKGVGDKVAHISFAGSVLCETSVQGYACASHRLRELGEQSCILPRDRREVGISFRRSRNGNGLPIDTIKLATWCDIEIDSSKFTSVGGHFDIGAWPTRDSNRVCSCPPIIRSISAQRATSLSSRIERWVSATTTLAPCA